MLYVLPIAKTLGSTKEIINKSFIKFPIIVRKRKRIEIQQPDRKKNPQTS